MPGTRSRQLRRALVLILVFVVAAGLIITEPRWLPLVVATDPYTATPAENFATGSAGIVLPPPAPLPGMTGEQINAALSQVKHALEASHLDPKMLQDRDPGPLLDLLAPDSASVVAGRLDSGDYGTTLIRLAPGSVLAATPRVNGEMTYSRVDWRGTPALSVVTNYVWAYAFRKPEGVVVVHSETTWMFPLVDNLRPTSRGMYLGRTSGYWHGMDCAAAAKGFTAPAPDVDRSANPGYSDNDPLDAYFDPSRPLRVESGCQGG
ncbi:MAG: hypothetical protein ACR2G2_14620 [Pseudonocardia sp.]